MSRRLGTPRGAVTIRAATAGDAVQLRGLRLEALTGQPEAFSADYDRNAADTAEVWVERIQRNEAARAGVICVAATRGGLVGMTGLHRGDSPKSRHGAFIWGVYVMPAWRGQGIAAALVEACIDWAREQGITVVKLGVVTTNTPAIRCYVRCGFTVYGIDPQTILYDGVYYDELLMARSI